MNFLSPVSDLMTTSLVSVGPDDSISVVQGVFESYKIHHVPVVEGDKLVGMISKNDLYHFMSNVCKEEAPEGKNPLKELHEVPVKKIMTSGLARLEPGDRIDVALELFKINRFHAIPVTKEDRTLVGILTTHDLIKALAEGDLKTD